MRMHNKLKFLWGCLILGVFITSSCEKYTIPEVKVDNATFSADVLPLFSKCTSCHSGSQKPNLLPANAYNSLTTGGYVNTQSPEESKIYKKMYSGGHSSILIEVEKKKILKWIELGAKND